MTWKEILQDENSNHSVAVPELPPWARKILRRRYADVEEVYQLRVRSKVRLWGIRRDNEFSLLWWDPEHRVFP